MKAVSCLRAYFHFKTLVALLALSGLMACNLSSDLINKLGLDSSKKITIPAVINDLISPNVPISGVCPAGLAEVTIVVDDVEVGRINCESAEYSGTIDLHTWPDGLAEISIVDSSSGTTITSTTVQVDRTPPSGSASVPSYVNQENVRAFPISGTCTDSGGKIRIQVGAIEQELVCSYNAFTTTFDLSSLPQGSTSVSITFYDAAQNTYQISYTTIVDTISATGITLSGVPDDPSAIIYLDISVNGSDAEFYRYKVGSAESTDCSSVTGYSEPIALATHITDDISALPDGNVRLCVLAIDAAGNQTDVVDAISANWRKDITIVMAIIGPYSPSGNPSNSTVARTVAISGVGLVDYKATVAKDLSCTAAGIDWASLAFTPVATAFTFSIASDGDYRVCALGRNVANYEQSSSSPSSSTPLVIDTVKPTFTLSGSLPAISNVANWTVRFSASEDVQGFEASDISLSNATLVSVTKVSSQSYDITFTANTDGVSRITIPGTGWTDLAGNTTSTASQFLEFTYDTGQPTAILSSTRSEPSMMTAFTLNINFNEDVTGFSATDLNVTGAALGALSGGPRNYSLTVTPDSQASALAIFLPADSVQDLGGNDNLMSATFTRTLDGTAPTVALSSSATSTVNSTFTVTVTASESLADIDINDFSISNGTALGFISLTQTSFELNVQPTVDGSVIVTLPLGQVHDLAGNANSSVVSLTRTYDSTSPSVVLSSAASGDFSSENFSTSITFSEPVTGFSVSDITVTNGTVGSLSGSGAAYTATILPTSEGLVSVRVAAGRAQDDGGNLNTASNTFSRYYDLTPPSCSITSGPSGWISTTSANFVFSCTDNRSVASVNCSLDGSPISCTSSTTLNLSSLAVGSHTVAFSATDAAGNVGALSSRTFSIDTSAPSAPSVTTANTDTASPSFTFSATDSQSGIDSYQCSYDTGSASYASCTSTKTYTNANLLAGQTYYFRVRAINNAGLTGGATAVSWTNGDFSAWGSCSLACGGGTQSRTCTNPTPSTNPPGLTCSGSSTQACNTFSCSCTLPWGGTIANGASVTAYSSSTPAGSCSSYSQTRTCSNGTLSGSYTNQTCSSGCTLPWGGNIAHGQSVTAYSSATSGCSTCSSISQTRTCNSGTLSGSYSNQSCAATCQYYGWPQNLQGRYLAAPAETNFCKWKHGAGSTVYSTKIWKIFNYGNEPCWAISTSGNSDVNSECIVGADYCQNVGCNIFEYINCQW